MRFRLDAALYESVSKEREREWQQGLLDLNAEIDGVPPTVTLRDRVDGGVDFLVGDAPEALTEIALPFADIKSIFGDYRDIIERLARAGGGAFGMRDFETLDYAKKLIHDEAGDVVLERLAGVVVIDHRVARRIFTLVFLVSSELPEHLITNHRHHGLSDRVTGRGR